MNPSWVASDSASRWMGEWSKCTLTVRNDDDDEQEDEEVEEGGKKLVFDWWW